MKLTVVLVACMAIVAVQSVAIQTEVPVGIPKSMMEMQRILFEVLLRVDQPLMLDEWIKLGQSLNTDQSNYLEYNEWMVKLENIIKVNGLLPQGEFFSVMQRQHVLQALGLFNFFYYANNWDILVQNIAWARVNVNPGIFVYSLSLAVIHRDDMQGLIMPQIYEIFPQQFLNSKYILAAEKFDWDVFNRQIMLEKEFKTIYLQKYPTLDQIWTDGFYNRDWKIWQWWKLMGLDDGWHLEGKSLLRDAVLPPQLEPIMKSLNKVWLPVDYTRDIEIWNDDSMLSYFTEDVSWNAYWYYLNLDYSKSLSAKTYQLDKDRRGEWWIYNAQQILARYYMERLSNGLGEIEELSWYGTYKTGYNPHLVDFNGNGYTVRKNYWEVQSKQNLQLLNRFLSVERRIQDVIASGKFMLKNGTWLDLTQPESSSIIYDLLQGNIDVIDWNYLGFLPFISNKYLAGNKYHDFAVEPNDILNYETMPRDPLFYSWLNILVKHYYLLKNQLKPYTRQELLLPGVEIVNVEISKLLTYFDLVDIDITTLLNDKIVFQDGRIVWDKTLLARQMRLNHKPFTFDIEVTSDKVQKVVVRVFLGPEFDNYGQKMSLIWNRENYMEIDEFMEELVVGKNVLHRSSDDFDWVASDPVSYSELYNYLMTSYGGSQQFLPNISQPHSLFPQRLILPHGWVKGMPMALFFMISPYTADFQQYSTYDHTYLSGIGSGVRHIDNMPFGYPFDRKIDSIVDFAVPNMKMKKVKIYHLENLDKYYPKRYENYGNFDYDF